MSISTTEERFLEIKSTLVRRGSSFAEIARRLGVSRPTVTLVAQGKRSSRRVQRAIARACNVKMEELW